MTAAAREPIGDDPPDWFGPLTGRLDRLPALPRHQVPPPDVPLRESAVLMLFGDAGPEVGSDVLLTRRAGTLRAHAGQVAFPGGRLDPGDAGPVAAALREAREETGLDPAGVEVAGIGRTMVIPPSRSLVHPVLAWWRRPGPVAPVDPAEVELVVRVPLAELLDPANRFTVRHPSGLAGPGFDVRGLFVWGFTAGVLSGLLTLAGLERPWDPAVVRPLPPAVPPVEEAP